MNKEISPKQALKNVKTYFMWRVQRAKKLTMFASSYTSINSKTILEIGAGLGPIAFNLSKNRNQIYSVDPSVQVLKLLKKFNPQNNIKAIKAVNEKLPFSSGFFDIIFSFDSFEHVKSPVLSMAEMSRVLKNNGWIFLEITPYYSLLTGHHLYNFSLMPAQYLPKRLIKWWLYRQKPQGIRTPQEAWNTFITLNQVKINTIRQLVKNNHLSIMAENFIFKIPGFIEIKINWIKHFGWLKDIIPMSYQLVLSKNNAVNN